MVGTSTIIRHVNDVVDARAVTAVFQPIVRLDSWNSDQSDPGGFEVVGYEALTRGPLGTPWESPLELFAAAAKEGRLAELDWVCRANAYRTALDADLPLGLTLFVNAEPEALRVPCPRDLTEIILAAQLQLRVVTEMTERSIGNDPAALLAATEACRGSGWGVALDDVGAQPASLAMMPFVHPDVIKLDQHLIQRPGGEFTARVVNAVVAYAERSGAAILAEGIETEAHLATALGMGATLGQGWYFGRPGPLPPDVVARRSTLSVPFVAPPGPAQSRTPYEIVAAKRPTAEATKRMLMPLSNYLECKAVDPAEPPLLLSCFQHAEYFTAATAHRYTAIAQTAAMVAVLGTEMPSRPVPGVRGAALNSDDPLVGEWNVIVVGPHFAGALVARDLADEGQQENRRFTYALTYDRDLVLDAARSLLHWVVPT